MLQITPFIFKKMIRWIIKLIACGVEPDVRRSVYIGFTVVGGELIVVKLTYTFAAFGG